MFQMSNRYPHVFSPIRLGRTTFRNRIFASPTSLPDYRNAPGMTDRQKMFYALRAKGGAASVSTGDGIVDYDTGFGHPHKIRLDDPDVYPSLGDMARSISQYGAVPTIELSHCGKFSNVANMIGDMESGKKAYGPIHEFTASGEEIFEMPKEMIESIARSYGRAAAMAKTAGFGMILIHAGHGWLLEQFMSPSNTRTDDFGGCFENRMRLTLMVIDEVRKAVGPGFPIEFRMSGAEFTENGYDLEYGVQIAKAVDGKVDLIHVSAGVHDDNRTFIVTHPSMFREHGCNVFLAARIKQEVKTPVATIGGLTDPAMLEEILASGKADVVELGRQMMADPFLPKKMLEGRESEIGHCLRCFTCMDQLRKQASMRCAINPMIGREPDYKPDRTDHTKTVLIAGGGPAGIEAALAADKAGHTVHLFEKEACLGGKLNYERYIPFKQQMYHLAQTLTARLEKTGVKVHLNTPLTRELALTFDPDVIISAMGADPLMLPIPGADRNNVFTCADLKKENPDTGDTIAIIGGGLVGCESAVHFAMEGKKVTIVEMLPQIAGDAAWPHRLALMQEIEKYGITVLTGYLAKEITDQGLTAADESGGLHQIPADSVMMAAGLRPLTSDAEQLRDAAPEFYIIGDNRQPAQLFQATSVGWFTGSSL